MLPFPTIYNLLDRLSFHVQFTDRANQTCLIGVGADLFPRLVLDGHGKKGMIVASNAKVLPCALIAERTRRSECLNQPIVFLLTKLLLVALRSGLDSISVLGVILLVVLGHVGSLLLGIGIRHGKNCSSLLFIVCLQDLTSCSEGRPRNRERQRVGDSTIG